METQEIKNLEIAFNAMVAKGISEERAFQAILTIQLAAYVDSRTIEKPIVSEIDSWMSGTVIFSNYDGPFFYSLHSDLGDAWFGGFYE